ncbi:hypothetical protein GQ44DRAFT_768939 [Phaeosphaeriaceae sp. PMI808]|nr:hypothetical protein GQ44DRAFT_768939 [Phaeosphaeriaceae sp. PMI808]
MNFELAAITPDTNKTVVDLLFNVFSTNICEDNMVRLQGLIADLLTGVYVVRTYARKDDKANSGDDPKTNWDIPFPIYYNEDKDLKYPYLPLAGDNSGGWFPLEAIKLANKPFPCSTLFAPALKAKTLDRHLLEEGKSGDEAMKQLGNKIFSGLIASRKFNMNGIEQDALALFRDNTKAGPYHVEGMDPVSFSFGPCKHQRYGECHL